MSGLFISEIPLSNVVSVLRAAEQALAIGNEECGGEPDNVYYDALHRVRLEITRLVAAAPDVDIAAQWCSGDSNHVSVAALQRAARTLRGL